MCVRERGGKDRAHNLKRVLFKGETESKPVGSRTETVALVCSV